MKIWLTKFPLPPSINEQLAPSRGRLIKTKKARDYDEKVKMWIFVNRDGLTKAQSVLLPFVQTGFGLRIDSFFAFQEQRILCKSARAKDWVRVLDANNRLKSAIDGLSAGLGIDDKFIFTGLCEKVICKSSVDEGVTFLVQPVRLRTLQDVQTQMENS